MSLSKNQPRPRGRPRSPAVDDAILRATLGLLVEAGIERTTIGAVAARAGVARATIYLRWPSRAALITAAFLHAKGRAPFPLTGDIETDLTTGAEWMRSIVSEPAFRATFSLVVRELLQEPRSETDLTYDRLAPNRLRVGEEYRRLASRAGLRTDVDPVLVTDVVMGTLLHRWLATGRPPTHADSEQVIDILLNGIKRRQAAAGSSGGARGAQR